MVARRKTKVQKRFRLKNQDYLEGSGLFSAIRDRFKQATGAVASAATSAASAAVDKFLPLRRAGLLPPDVRKFLEQNGDKQVTSMTIIRVPIERYVNVMLNAITLGKFRETIKNLGYDNVMHLRLQFNLDDGSAWFVEKNEVIMIKKYTGEQKNQENMPISNYQGGLTMNEILNKTREAMGDANFSNYTAFELNCQHFILNILRANGLLTDEYRKFIMQDAQKIFENLPSYTKGVSKGLTDLAARFNRLFKGEKLPKNKITHNNKMRGTNAWLNHVAKVKSQNPDMAYKQVLVKAKATYNKSSSGSGISMAGRAMGNEEIKLAVQPRGRKPMKNVIDQVAMGILTAGRNAPLRRMKMSTRPVKEPMPTAALPLPVQQDGNGRIVTKPPTLYPATTPPVVAPNQRSSKSQELGLNNYKREAVKFPVSMVARPNLGMYLG